MMTKEQKEELITRMIESADIRAIYDASINKSIDYRAWIKAAAYRVFQTMEEDTPIINEHCPKCAHFNELVCGGRPNGENILTHGKISCFEDKPMEPDVFGRLSNLLTELDEENCRDYEHDNTLKVHNRILRDIIHEIKAIHGLI